MKSTKKFLCYSLVLVGGFAAVLTSACSKKEDCSAAELKMMPIFGSEFTLQSTLQTNGASAVTTAGTTITVSQIDLAFLGSGVSISKLGVCYMAAISATTIAGDHLVNVPAAPATGDITAVTPTFIAGANNSPLSGSVTLTIPKETGVLSSIAIGSLSASYNGPAINAAGSSLGVKYYVRPFCVTSDGTVTYGKIFSIYITPVNQT